MLYHVVQPALIVSPMTSEQSIRGTNNSLKGTPLAATIVAFTDNTIEIYVYYVDNINKLTRVVYTGTKSAGSWGTQQEIYDAGDVATTSGLAALADTNRGGNHVYFRRPDMNAYVSYLMISNALSVWIRCPSRKQTPKMMVSRWLGVNTKCTKYQGAKSLGNGGAKSRSLKNISLNH